MAWMLSGIIFQGNEWDLVKCYIMFDILQAKFQQCPEYRQLLIPGRQYSEDTPNYFWVGTVIRDRTTWVSCI